MTWCVFDHYSVLSGNRLTQYVDNFQLKVSRNGIVPFCMQSIENYHQFSTLQETLTQPILLRHALLTFTLVVLW